MTFENREAFEAKLARLASLAERFEVRTGSPGMTPSGESAREYRLMPAPLDVPWLAADPGTHATLPQSAALPESNTLYDLQWHFDYLGDIETIWKEYSGAGIHVGIFDDGLQTTHPDLAANVDPSRYVTVQGQIIDPLDAATFDPDTGYFPAPHGTAVAGLIGAANNDIGTIGVAWGASLTGVTIFSGPANINSNYAGFLEAASQSANFDVINHSWGKFPGFWQDGVSNAQDQSLIDRWFTALETGRGGLGTIQVKAAGNADQNSNGDESGSTRATIVVGAYDDDGDASYYSSYGANLLVSAPSSGVVDFFLGAINKGQVTTDATGAYDAGGALPFGYNGLPDWDYTNAFGGTSGATPLVTGVVALMLDANPNLGWRDVQNILAYSAHEIGSGVGGIRLNDENNTWHYNGADNWNGGGLHYSEDYGYGALDAYNAVRMAEVWNLFSGPKTSANESSFRQSTTDPVELPDGKQTDIRFRFDGPDFIVDYVNVTIDVSHTKLDDLEISLISPDGGMTSLVDFRFELFYQTDLQQATLDFGANGFRGENGAGEWTLRIVDRWAGDEGVLSSASVTLHGTDTSDGVATTADDVYHYTDEVFKTITRDSSRVILSDTDGGTDWLDMSAMTDDLIVKMQQGNNSTVGGITFLRIELGTQIENLVTGDGDDTLTGSRGANAIYGMRGDDDIFSADGDDLLSGGAGNDTLRGGAGNDVFLFDRALDPATNVDTVVDFDFVYYEEAPADRIWLDHTVFTTLALGNLAEDAFAVGSAATDSLDRLIYDDATGALYYDADGLGGQAQIRFAQFDQFVTVNNGPHPVLSFQDFVVVDTSNAGISGSGNDRVQADAPTTSTSVDHDRLFGNGTPITGTRYDDEILGKDADDTIDGLAGNDLLAGGAGDDEINGGAGSDSLYGQEGDDILRGNYASSSMDGDNGDTMFGGDGNDVLHGSAQTNYRYHNYTTFGGPGDSLIGGDGDDVLYGYDGNDGMDGGDGNDHLVGGAGSDYFSGGNGDDFMDGGAGSDIFFGGFGNDTFIVGKGIENLVYGGDLVDPLAPELNVIGFDTVVFEGNFADYKMTGGVQFYFSNDAGLLFSNTTAGDDLAAMDNTTIDWRTIDRLVFADRTIDTADRSFGLTGGDLLVLNDYVNAGTPVTLTADGWESIASVLGAGDVTITDVAAIDELDFVRLLEITGTTTITSDAIETLDLANVDGSVIVHAAAGERAVAIRTYGLRLDAHEQLSDNAATEVSLSFATEGVVGGPSATPSIATAGVNGANLSFQSARAIHILASYEPVDVRWDVRSATTIDLNAAFRVVHEVTGDFDQGFEGGSLVRFNILTALDDSVLATAGGSAEFRYIGNEEGGRDYVRFGNLGAVNASNDGTEGPEATQNAGLGLRGHVQLAVSKDEARILGSDAFQGGTIDGGTGNLEPDHNTPDADTIRMTFGVAEAIGDISDSISNFEVLHLHATAQSHTADVSDFDAMTQIVVSSGSAATGTNTIVNVRGDSVVTFKTSGDFDPLSNQLGTVQIEMMEGGTADRVKLEFVGVEADGVDQGRIVVRGAEIVEVSGNNLDYKYGELDWLGLPLPLGPDTDPFTAIGLDLQDATTVYVSGETGWDFTQPGTNIAHVTRIDASAVTAPGRLSGVTARAQTSDSVTFIGGAGEDVFEGGDGADTLAGGDGDDVYVLNAGSSGDTITEQDDGGIDTIRTGLTDVDLGDYVNVENVTLIGDLDLRITGNAAGNRLAGNAGDNEIHGGDGGDTAVFSGKLADYVVTRNADGSLTVADAEGSVRDGVDTLFDIEYLAFSDGRFSTSPVAPTDVRLSSTTVRENAFDGVVVGKLTATDSPGDTAAFALLDDAGGRFKLVGDEIRVVFDYLLDYEQATSYDIAVRVTDLDGLTFDKTISIGIEDVNPEYIVGRGTDDVLFGGDYNDLLNGNGGDDVLRGNGGSDILIGWTGDDTAVFSGNYADYEIRFADVYVDAFTVVDRRSGPDGTGFDGIDYVVYDDHFDFPSYAAHRTVEHLRFADITVATSDLVPYQGPTDIELTDLEVSENATAGTVVGTLSATDPSVDETFTYALTDDAGGRFAIAGDKLVVAAGAAFDFETEPAIDVGVQVTDSDGNTYTRTFALGVRDVNEAPTVSLVPLLSSLDETTSTTTRIAVAEIVLDDDALGSNVLSVAGADAGAFEVVGSTLYLRSGLALDHTVLPQLRVSVLVDDPALPGAPDATSGVFTLSIADVLGVRMVHGTTADDWLIGNAGNDWFVGGGGEDIFEGGRGDDTYVLDSLGDIVVERGAQGNDTVRSSVNHWLGRAVENLVLTGSLATRGIGNELDNRITGNGADNLLLGEDGDDELRGEAGDDTLEGGDGHDSLLGGDGDDALSGEDGDDSLLGEAGQDALDGGDGDDGLDGGVGNDTLLGQRGDDTLLGGAGNDRLEGNDGEDLLDGGAHLDELFGGNGRDTLLGGTGNDFLDGGAGNDHLSGGSGADVLVGGAGRDVLEGGSGYDLFSFSRLDDSGTSAATRDVIVDFVQGWDMFDFEALDAVAGTPEDDAFRFVGDTFSGAAGELRAYERAGQTLVEADVDGNGLADFSIALNTTVSLNEQDFLL